jgi:hypothetical protein
MDESELREVMDAKLGGSYEVQMLHRTSESTFAPPGMDEAIGTDYETEIEVVVYPDSTPTAVEDLRRLEGEVDGLHLQGTEVSEYLGGEVEVHASFVLIERTMSVEMASSPPTFGTEGGESGAESEEDRTPREGQIDVESAHTAVLRVYTDDDGEVHLLREGGHGGACDHDHGGAVVADVDEQYDSLSALLEDDDLCRECGAILVHQFNLPPGRVPGSLRRWADGG